MQQHQAINLRKFFSIPTIPISVIKYVILQYDPWGIKSIRKENAPHVLRVQWYAVQTVKAKSLIQDHPIKPSISILFIQQIEING